jgi:hypothetical protein
MKGWRLGLWSPGIVALSRAFAVSTALFTPVGLAAQVFGQLLPVTQNEPSPDTGVAERATALLEQLHQDQTRLQDAVRRLEDTQQTGWDRQTRAIRQYQTIFAERLSAQRDQDRQSIEEVARTALTILFSVAGALLFAMVAVAYSVLRALQRLQMRPWMPQLVMEQGSLSAGQQADAQLLSLMDELERRWLKLTMMPGPAGAGSPSNHSKPAHPPTMFPGDFL